MKIIDIVAKNQMVTDLDKTYQHRNIISSVPKQHGWILKRGKFHYMQLLYNISLIIFPYMQFTQP